ncbi:hypothetical protein PI125_g14246 [Phytophthora idaei]|nr:hypothetical protein PI125_g14246 [Phytophthora idaei]
MSPRTSFSEVQKSNSTRKARLPLVESARVTRRTARPTHRHNPRSVLLVVSNPRDSRLSSLCQWLLRNLVARVPAPLLLQGRLLLVHHRFANHDHQVFLSPSHRRHQRNLQRGTVRPRHRQLHQHRHSLLPGVRSLHPPLVQRHLSSSPSSSTGATVAVAEPSGRESAALTLKGTSPSVEISPRAGRLVDQQAARSSFRPSLRIELENADDGEVLSLLNAVASIPSSDDESDEGSVLQLVVSPVPPTKTGSESLQSSESSAKPPAASEPLVASDSPGEVVPEFSASLSVDVDEVRKSPASTHDQGPDHNFVDDAESDAESTSKLVFASGDESEANTPTDSAVLPSVAQGSSVENTSAAVDDSPPGESAAQDEAAISTNKMPVSVPRLRTTRELWMFHRLFLSLLRL